MNLQTAKKTLEGWLQPLVAKVGFQRVNTLTYGKPMLGAEALLLFPCRIDSAAAGCFTCNVGVRFELLNRILGHSQQDPHAPTIMTPLHLLRPEKSFDEWRFSHEQDLSNLSEAVLSEIRAFAIPFLERNSDIENVKRNLQCEKPKDWFVLGPEQRIILLAAIHLAAADKELALATLDDAIAKLKGAAPPRILHLQIARKRMMSGPQK
jgi:hypothetical protein